MKKSRSALKMGMIESSVPCGLNHSDMYLKGAEKSTRTGGSLHSVLRRISENIGSVCCLLWLSVILQLLNYQYSHKGNQPPYFISSSSI